jgi:hypothetical protein
MSVKLEDFLAGKPLNERMGRIMAGNDGDEEIDIETAITSRTASVEIGEISDQERGFLERMVGSAGWRVLLKLLDTELQRQEDAARRDSLKNPLTRKDEVAAMWATLAANKQARNSIAELVEREIGKLEAAKKKRKCATGQTKTQAEVN